MIYLVLVGLFLVLAGMGFMMASLLSGAGSGEGQLRGGGVVMIGPIPILFGSDVKWAGVAAVLAVALVLIALAFGVV